MTNRLILACLLLIVLPGVSDAVSDVPLSPKLTSIREVVRLPWGKTFVSCIQTALAIGGQWLEQNHLYGVDNPAEESHIHE